MGTTKTAVLSLGVVAMVAASTVSCSGSSKSPTSASTVVTMTSLSLSGTAAFTAVGQTTQLSAIATMSDGTTQNVTSSAVWQSSNPSVASVSSSGLVTSIGQGTCDIAATHLGARATTTATVMAQSACSISVAPSTLRFRADGGTGSIAVSASAPACSWTAISTATWLRFVGGSSGTGSGSVTVSPDAHAGRDDRVAHVNIAGQRVEVVQDGVGDGSSGPAFQYSVAPSTRTVSSAGGTFTIAVTTNRPDAQWTATSSQPWLTITSGSSGTGNGAVSYRVAGNTNSYDRIATVTVSGLSGLYAPAVHTLTQLRSGF